MYSKRAGLVLGFHGCDKSVRDKVVFEKGELLEPSKNEYDWLGYGVYFWENNYTRALDFATHLKESPPPNRKVKIKEPSVLGAIIDLGYCLDLIDSEYLKLLKEGYKSLKKTHEQFDTRIPRNVPLKNNCDLILRHLDCAVIEMVHKFNSDNNLQSFDSVRGVFFEGEDLYPNAGFKEKNHIQITIRNPNCIKGYFIPRNLDSSFRKP